MFGGSSGVYIGVVERDIDGQLGGEIQVEGVGERYAYNRIRVGKNE